MGSIGTDQYEITRRLVDLFFVSVLLDAGAGEQWKYRNPETQQYYERSEGIAIATLTMFTGGEFCTTRRNGTPPSVTGKFETRCLTVIQFNRLLCHRKGPKGSDNRTSIEGLSSIDGKCDVRSTLPRSDASKFRDLVVEFPVGVRRTRSVWKHCWCVLQSAMLPGAVSTCSPFRITLAAILATLPS